MKAPEIRAGSRILRRFGDQPLLGFDPYDMNDKTVPRFPATGLKMRHINVVDRASGVRRTIPVGKLSTPIWTEPPPPLDLIDAATGATSTFVVSSRVGERQRGMA
jgi:hypothetical protein